MSHLAIPIDLVFDVINVICAVLNVLMLVFWVRTLQETERRIAQAKKIELALMASAAKSEGQMK